jgi:hypothetical protein
VEVIEGFCNAFKIKYVYLDKLFNGKLDVKKGRSRLVDTVNIFINFESLYYGIRNTYVEKQIKDYTKKEQAAAYRRSISAFINVAAHYRAYFTRHKIKTNIVYYFNDIPDDVIDYNNTALCDTYREHFCESLNNIEKININQMIHETIPVFRTICEYLENVYVISSKRVESSLIPMVIDMEGALPSNLNIIISKDVYDYQYTNQNYLVITKQKNEPVLLTKKNVIKFMCWKYNLLEPGRIIHYSLLPFIIACLGDKKRSIPSIRRIGFKSIYKSLIKLYDAGYIFDEDPDTMNISNLLYVLNDKDITTRKDTELGNNIMANYKVTDLPSQFSVLNKTQKHKIIDQIIDRTDIASLMDINERYFEDFPLQLMELNQYSRNEDFESDD